MFVNCLISCDAAHLRDAKVRFKELHLIFSRRQFIGPGDMGRTFAKIAAEFSHNGTNVLSTSPWIVTFENFLTNEEAGALICINEGNWERSTVIGDVNEQVFRTLRRTYCLLPLVPRLAHRIQAPQWHRGQRSALHRSLQERYRLDGQDRRSPCCEEWPACLQRRSGKALA